VSLFSQGRVTVRRSAQVCFLDAIHLDDANFLGITVAHSFGIRAVTFAGLQLVEQGGHVVQRDIFRVLPTA